MAVENRVERATDWAQRLVVEWGLRERGGEAGGEEQVVALPRRQLERVGQPRDDAGPRPRPSLLDETHVTLRRARSHCQLELAQSASLA